MDILRSDSPESNLLKRCTGPCQRELPVTAEFFYRTKSGFVARCKMCINAQSSIYYAEHQERIREKQGQYNAENRKRQAGIVDCVCKICGQGFKRRQYAVTHGHDKICSPKCAGLASAIARGFNPLDPVDKVERKQAYDEEYYRQHKDKKLAQRKRDHYRSRYGLSVADIEGMFSAQHGTCAICSKDLAIRKYVVDHHAETGKVRGLLCFNCNNLLGMCHDDITILQTAIQYLIEGVI